MTVDKFHIDFFLYSVLLLLALIILDHYNSVWLKLVILVIFKISFWW